MCPLLRGGTWSCSVDQCGPCHTVHPIASDTLQHSTSQHSTVSIERVKPVMSMSCRYIMSLKRVSLPGAHTARNALDRNPRELSPTVERERESNNMVIIVINMVISEYIYIYTFMHDSIMITTIAYSSIVIPHQPTSRWSEWLRRW